jgi:glycosyltransferase involved in cell wall biosynthesis
MEEHGRELARRYPHYSFEVFCFWHGDPLRETRKRLYTAEKRPKILHILHSYDSLAGTEKHVTDLSAGIADEYASIVAAPDVPQSLCLYTGKDLTSCRVYASVPWPVTPVETPGYLDTWKSVFDEIQPDLVHLHHMHRHPLGLLDFLAKQQIPLIVSVHDHFLICPDWAVYACPGTDKCTECFPRKFSSRPQDRDYPAFRRDLILQALDKATAVVAPSVYMAQKIKEIYGKIEVLVIPHGISAENVEKRNTVSQPPTFGFIGNLTPVKGVTTLTAAASILNGTPEIHLWGACPDSTLHLLREQKGLVYHGGYLPRDLDRILSGVDVGIIPSSVPESFCYTLSELQQYRVPPLVSDLGSLSERVEDGVNGWKIKPNDPAVLAAKIQYLQAHPEEIARVREKISPPATGEDMANKYKDLYRWSLRKAS